MGLGIRGDNRDCSFSMQVVPDEEGLHPSIVAKITVRERERMLVAVGMGRNAQAARRLVESELPQRNFDAELAHTLHCWRRWVASCNCQGPYAEWVQRSALVLKMMTYAPTGSIVAAPTTSLPENLSGERNWDYRFTWLRDATFTLYAFNMLGFTEEARAFTHWLQRLSYTNGEDLQIIYGIRGERELPHRALSPLTSFLYPPPSPNLTPPAK